LRLKQFTALQRVLQVPRLMAEWNLFLHIDLCASWGEGSTFNNKTLINGCGEYDFSIPNIQPAQSHRR
jgi:hypothetical protein